MEEKNGNTVKINLGGKIMEKVIQKIEDEIDECDIDIDDDECYETVFKAEGNTAKGNTVHVQVKKPVKFWLEFPYAIICALAYLVFGFYNIYGGWALSWVIFITIPVYYTFVEAIYKKRFSEFAYSVLTAFVYLVLGLYYGNWHPSWLIFVTVPIYYCISSALDRKIHG